MLQTVAFRENDDVGEMLTCISGPYTRLNLATVLARQRKYTLQAYFELNARDPDVRSTLYHDIPGIYTFDRRAKACHPRRGNDQPVGRMIYAAPAQGKTFCLRLLLTQVAGATSFQELRIFQVHVIFATLHRSIIIAIVNAVRVCFLQAIVTFDSVMTFL